MLYTKKHLSCTQKLFRLQRKGKVFFMGTKAQSLAHTKWLCKYHIIFTPKFRRKIIFRNYVKVYGKFSSGDPDTSKTAASWFGACIFLIVAATILRSFFL